MAGEEMPVNAKRPHITNGQLIAAIKSTAAIPSLIGLQLGISAAEVKTRINSSPALRECVAETQSALKDHGRAAIAAQIKSGNAVFAAKYLKEIDELLWAPATEKLGYPKKTGRPSIYTEKLGAEICEWIMSGNSLLTYCQSDKKPPYSTIMRWVLHVPAFSESYARARETQGDHDADKIKELGRRIEAGEIDPNAARVVIDALKWTAARRKPKVYGDRPPPPPGMEDDTSNDIKVVVTGGLPIADDPN
jgi:hypothetical protein